MESIGIFFGTDSGTTRLIANKIMKDIRACLGDDAVAKSLNVNRIAPDDLLAHRFPILGTPTCGAGLLPGLMAGPDAESWAEFLPKLVGSASVAVLPTSASRAGCR